MVTSASAPFSSTAAPDGLDDARPAELLALMQRGDVAALDHLARAYGQRLAGVARRCCRNASDVDDAVQLALVQAERSMTGFRGEGNAVAWLSTLVARSCYRLNAAAERSGTLTGDAACWCDAADDPAAQLEHKELGTALGAALMEVPRTDRLAFLLSVEGWTGPEIAAHFDLTHDAVRGRLKRARQILRQALADTPWGPPRT